MTDANGREWLTPPLLARRKGVSLRTVYNWLRAKRVESRRTDVGALFLAVDSAPEPMHCRRPRTRAGVAL